MNKALTITATLIALLFATASSDAKPRHYRHPAHHAKLMHVADQSCLPDNSGRIYGCGEAQGTSTAGYSASSGGRVAGRRYGPCDGIHRCICGATAANEAGLPWDYNGWNLKKASEWRHFQHMAFSSATHGVAPHHVLKIVGGDNCANATVHDETGTYQRNVCRMTFVSIRGRLSLN